MDTGHPGLRVLGRQTVAAAFRLLASSLATFLVILFMAGLPLLISAKDARVEIDPARVLAAARGFLVSALDGTLRTFKIGRTAWDLREIYPKFLSVSFLYTAIPGAAGILLGTVAGAAARSRRRGTLDRLTDLALGTPDFLLILAVQLGAVWILDTLGIDLSLGGNSRLALLPLSVMGVYPFFLARRCAAEASREAETSDYIAFARAKGLPEGWILRRHLGAAVIPRLEAELPVIVSFMQGSLFITERAFALPGMARLLFDSAFSGQRKHMMWTIYQYDHVVLSLTGLAVSGLLVFAALRLGLGAARKVLTRE